MSCVRNIRGYQLSREYSVLWALALSGSVVCISDYGKEEVVRGKVFPVLRDVCQTIAHVDDDGSVSCVQLCARGICYVYGESVEDFIVLCRACNVEFIMPVEVGS